MRAVLLSLLLLLVGAASAASDATRVSGLVRAHEGGRPAAGIAGVLVSNGREIVHTDPTGRYAIDLAHGETLFLIKPAGFEAVFDADGVERFWRHHFPQGSPALRYGGVETTPIEASGWDFSLRRRSRNKDALEVLLFGDPQPKHTLDVRHFERDIIEPLMDQHAMHVVDPAHRVPRMYFKGAAADLGLTLGDVVDDDLSLLPLVQAATARLGVPWLYAPGNHDIDLDADSDAASLLSYRQVFGPDTLAWEEPQASFVLLDNVVYLPGGQPAYIGGLREDQFAFLEAYLKTLDPARRLVIGAHIPFFDTRSDRETFRRTDRERLFALLRSFERVLLVSAHGHVQRHYMHVAADGWQGAQPAHEFNLGAVCGGYWGGMKDAEGIPDAVMADGTPNGFARLTLAADGSYALRWQVARDPAHPGIALHAPKVLRRGAWPGVGLYANVLMGLADDRVEFQIDDGDWRPMQRVERADPRVLAINLADDASETLRGYDRTPEAVASTHLWRAALPTDLAVGEHRVVVRTFDRWRGELRAETVYQLVDAQP